MSHPTPDHHPSAEEVEHPFSLNRLLVILRGYFPAIVLSILAVVVGYTIFAALALVTSPASRTVTLPFRLNFEGASEGRYPNGRRFSSSDILATTVLFKVYSDNKLVTFTDFSTFTKSIFVLEDNPAYERLARDYAAALSDPRLSAVDRDRLQREFDAKRSSLSKDEYSINYLQSRNTAKLPQTLIEKVLREVLAEWSRYVAVDQHLLQYEVSIISPDFVVRDMNDSGDYIADVQMLRSKIRRVMENIEDLEKLPGAPLARTADRMSLRDIRLRLVEIVRFQLDPLVSMINSSGLVHDRQATIRFLENQLAYDQRNLQETQMQVDAIRQALAVYTGERMEHPAPARQVNASGTSNGQGQQNGETLVPQISDSFLDRLVTMANQAADVHYRQQVAEQYQHAALMLPAAQQAVAYDTDILAQVRNGGGTNATVGPEDVRARVSGTQHEVRDLVAKMNDLYVIVSRNLNPATELYTATSVPVMKVERTLSALRLLAYGVVLFLVAIPIIIMACLVHYRIQRERSEERAAEA
jgi:hypothetical protein